MKIAILGAGNIGGNLGKRFAEQGHTIVFGVRDPNKAAAAVSACGAKASATNVKDAAAAGDVVVLAVPGSVAQAAVKDAGDLAGKILIDATNALDFSTGGPQVAVATSQAEELAKLTSAKVVKAFNTCGAEHILHPTVGGVPVDVFLCGDDADAKKTVAGLSEAIGFNPVDMGPLVNARFAEHLATGWIWLAMKGGAGRNIAFKLMR